VLLPDFERVAQVGGQPGNSQPSSEFPTFQYNSKSKPMPTLKCCSSMPPSTWPSSSPTCMTQCCKWWLCLEQRLVVLAMGELGLCTLMLWGCVMEGSGACTSLLLGVSRMGRPPSVRATVALEAIAALLATGRGLSPDRVPISPRWLQDVQTLT
jgi:hypothetical protein